MTPTVITFAISGLTLVILVLAKMVGRGRSSIFPLNIISYSDGYIRRIYHRLIHFYSDTKDGAHFVWKKQLPMQSRNWLNKLSTYLNEMREQYSHNMRDSRLLKKTDGLSEFFKSMSEIEKGNGEINESYEEDLKGEDK